MSFEIQVLGVDGYRPIALTTGKQLLGRDASCQVRIDHPELAQTAGVVDVSGEVVFFENRNPFPIYIGNAEVQPGGVSEWRVGTNVLLSPSVSLQLQIVGAVATEAVTEEKKASNPTQMITQIAVTVGCLLLSIWMLMEEPEPAATSDESVLSFDELVLMYEGAGGPELKDLESKQRLMLDYLTEARTIERRWGERKQEESRLAYELILTTPADEQDTLISQTKDYAASRIDAMR